MTITILTPTYNRAGTLPKLFESLQGQTSKDFEWIVIDDGSKDNTTELVKEFVEKAEGFLVTYLKQDNSGKHVALNNGISKAQGELIFIVDSDDWLSDNAVETILEYREKYSSQKQEKQALKEPKSTSSIWSRKRRCSHTR